MKCAKARGGCKERGERKGEGTEREREEALDCKLNFPC